MSYQTLNQKKFLDANGLTYFAGKLNNYPTNGVIEAVVEGIQDALAEKQNVIQFDTTANWNSKLSYIPALGDIIVYLDKGTVGEGNEAKDVPGFKVGDGNAYLIDLPFVGDEIAEQILALLTSHTSNTDIHTTSTEKTFWNNKLNFQLTGENLILNRQ